MLVSSLPGMCENTCTCVCMPQTEVLVVLDLQSEYDRQLLLCDQLVSIRG